MARADRRRTVALVRITDDDLDAITFQASETGEHVRTAEVLTAWADAATEDSPVTRATLLVAAGDQYGFAGDEERRLELCRRAVADGGGVPADARCYLVSALLELGRPDEAKPYLDALLSEPDRHVHVDEFLGESLEAAGRHLQAMGVFAAGYSRAVTHSPADAAMLLHGRRRCREALGLPADELDRRAWVAGAPRLLDEDELDWALELEPGEPDREIVVFVTEADWDATTAPLAGADTVEGQFAVLERALRESDLGLPKVLAPIDVPALLATAARWGRGPDDEDMRYLHGLERVRDGHGLSWPPGRNDPCWCGRGAKYKKCCGRADR